MEIGFIGLGNMGAPMARNLIAARQHVKGFDVTGTQVDGVGAASSAAEAAKDTDAVITMLPNGDIIRAVYAEIVPVGKPGACYIDCSTIDVENARAAAAAAEARGLLAVDAPVSGAI